MNSPLRMLRALARVYFGAPDSPVRWTQSRTLAMLVWLPLCLVLGLCNWACLLLDELLFPQYRRVAVKAPVFIVGPPRGGTTFLHRLLAKDTERFAWFAFGEMVFAPSISQRYVLYGLDCLDRLVGSPVRRLMAAAEKHWFEPYYHMHRVSLFEAEEDFVMLGYILENHLFLAVFPFLDLYGRLWFFDRDVPREEQDQMLRFYRRCLQRHLYFHGSDKTHLSKNPFFTPMLAAVRRAFPDARFLLNVRDPREQLPSFLSIWDALYRGIGNREGHYLDRDFIVEWVRYAYLHGGDELAKLDAEHGHIVYYQRLVADPEATVLAFYRAFGFAPGEAYAAVLAEMSRRAKDYESLHHYALESYGLTEEQLREEYAEVLTRFGYERPSACNPPSASEE